MTDTRDLARIEDPESRKMIEDLRHMQRLPNGVKEHELAYFAEVCKRTGLSPFSTPPQIYMVARWNNDLQRNACTIQTGIDGYRLVSDDRIDGMDPPEFTYDADGNLFSATVRVYRKGCARPFAATAFLSEYVQRRKDGKPTQMWLDKPHIMLSKCAEALVRRMAFPMLLSGLYTSEEMMQADRESAAMVQAEPTAPAKVLAPLAKPTLWDECKAAWDSRANKGAEASMAMMLLETAKAVGAPLGNGNMQRDVAAMSGYGIAPAFLAHFKGLCSAPGTENDESHDNEPPKAKASPWESYIASGGGSDIAYAALVSMGKTVRDEADLAAAFNAAAESDKGALVAALKAARKAIADAKAAEAPANA